MPSINLLPLLPLYLDQHGMFVSSIEATIVGDLPRQESSVETKAQILTQLNAHSEGVSSPHRIPMPNASNISTLETNFVVTGAINSPRTYRNAKRYLDP